MIVPPYVDQMHPLKLFESEQVSAFAVYEKLKKKKGNRKQNLAQVKKMRHSRKRASVNAGEVGVVEIDALPGTSTTPEKGKKKRKSSKGKESLGNNFEVVDIDKEASKSGKEALVSPSTSKKNSKSAQMENGRKSSPNKVPSVDDSGKKGKKTSKNKTPSDVEEQEVVSLSGDEDDEIQVVKVNTSKQQEDEDEDEANGDSIKEGRKLLAYLLNPVTPEDFLDHTWEKRPLHIRRYLPEYFKPILSTQAIDNMLRTNNIQFTKHLDVTSYSDGKRETHNPVGRAMPRVVWDYYKNGCSIRLLNPQSFIPKLTLLNSSLQEYFGCFVGANAYLTPPNSQGFAPHYDDIEAFIVQIEGKKHWRLYGPRSDKEILPRFSSPNFNQEEIGEPYMEITLEAGDLLYFPRGYIHQADTMLGEHSLHVTLSTYQRTTWGDLLEKMLPTALKIAMEEDTDFREGLPVGYLNYMGVVNAEEITPSRTKFFDKVKSLMGKLINYAPVDAAVDQMGKQFMHDALPPVLTVEEKRCTAFEDGERMTANGKIINSAEISQHTRIKLIRKHILRLVSEEDEEGVRLYYSLDNSLEYHGEEPQFLEITIEQAPAVECLIQSYPKFMCVSDLPLQDDDQKLLLAGDLWDRGLLLTYGPLKKI